MVDFEAVHAHPPHTIATIVGLNSSFVMYATSAWKLDIPFKHQELISSVVDKHLFVSLW